MTTTIERPSEPPQPQVPPPPKPVLTADQRFFRSLLETLFKKDELKGPRLQGEELQERFLGLWSRVRDPGRTPDRVFSRLIAAQPDTRTTLQDCETVFQNENRPIHDEMNKIAIRATQINARLAQEALERLTEKIRERVAYEQTGWPVQSLPFVESAFVGKLKSLLPEFTKQAAKTSTTADEGGRPADILAWFFDL